MRSRAWTAGLFVLTTACTVHDVVPSTTTPTLTRGHRCDGARQFVPPEARVHVQRSDPLTGPSQVDARGSRLATWSAASLLVHDLASGWEVLATRAVDRDRWGWIDDRLVTLHPAEDAWVASLWSGLADEPIEQVPITLEPDLGAPWIVPATGLLVAPWLIEGSRCDPDMRAPSALAWRRLLGEDIRVERLGLREPACLPNEIFWSGDGTWAAVQDLWIRQLVSLDDGRWGAELSADTQVLAAGRSVLITAEAGHVYAVPVIHEQSLPSLGERRELGSGSVERALVGARDEAVVLVEGRTVQVVDLADAAGELRQRTLATDERPLALSPDGCALIVSDSEGRLGALGFRAGQDRWVGQPRATLIVDPSLVHAIVPDTDRSPIALELGPAFGLESSLPLDPVSPARLSIEATDAGVAIVGVAPARVIPWPASVSKASSFASDRSVPSMGHVALSSESHVALLTFAIHPWTMLSDGRELGRPEPAALTVHDVARDRSWTTKLDEPTAMTMTMDTLLVASGRDRSTLTRLDLADGRQRARTRLPKLPGGPLVAIDASRDNALLAGVTNDPAHLVMIDLEHGELRLAQDLRDPRQGPSDDSRLRFRDLGKALLVLSDDGSWLTWTDPALRSDGAHTSVWRVGAGFELLGRYAWVMTDARSTIAADVSGRVFEFDSSTLELRRWLQVYANGAWVVTAR